MESTNTIGQIVKTYAVPYYRHTYHSKLSAEEIRERLLQHIDTREESFVTKIFGNTSSKKDSYKGKFEGNSFKIQRIKKGKNSNRPVILGEVTAAVNTTQVAVVMRLPYLSLLSLIVWFGVLIYIGLEDGNTITLTEFNIYFVLFMVCFAYLVTTISFNYEAAKTKKFLKRVLQPVSLNNQSDWIIRN